MQSLCWIRKTANRYPMQQRVRSSSHHCSKAEAEVNIMKRTGTITGVSLASSEAFMKLSMPSLPRSRTDQRDLGFARDKLDIVHRLPLLGNRLEEEGQRDLSDEQLELKKLLRRENQRCVYRWHISDQTHRQRPTVTSSWAQRERHPWSRFAVELTIHKPPRGLKLVHCLGSQGDVFLLALLDSERSWSSCD